MHLLITSAEDVTSDLICERLTGTILRVNWERWNEYSVEISENGFRISDHFGREVNDRNIGNIIWRKPVSSVDAGIGEGWYCFHEFKYAIESIMEWIRQKQPRKLPIDPISNKAIDKLKQLRVANQYIPVPEWIFTCTPSQLLPEPGEWIVKSMTGKPIPGSEEFAKVIYTTLVKPRMLADGFPWFIQRRVEAAYDLTILYVDGQQFGYVLDRKLFAGLDWRQSIGMKEVDEAWKTAAIPASLSESISSIMTDLGLRFGRCDLLTNTPSLETTWFLEVNPNGQWAWLDLDQNNGLFDTVVKFLTSE